MNAATDRTVWGLSLLVITVAVLTWWVAAQRRGSAALVGGDPMGLDEIGYDRPEWRETERRIPTVLEEARRLRAIDRMRLGDPLMPPYRRYDTMELGPVPTVWNVPTQGEPGLFQVVGYLYQEDQPERMLRLFGRRIDRNQYEYYTTSPNDALLKIPINRQRDDEIMTDDLVAVTGFKEPFKAVLYDVEELRYVPYIR